MTKPVIESTEVGQLSNYGWRIRQLERRPDRRGDRLPWAMIEWEGSFAATTGVTYGFGSLVPFTAGIKGFAASGIMDPDLSLGVIYWFGSDTAYMMTQATVQWETTFAQRVVTWAFVGNAALPSSNPQLVPSISDGSIAGLRDSMFTTYVAAESTYAYGYFQQDSGSNKNLVYASVSLTRLDDSDDALGI